ncbi:MAG: 4Fe-4S binding protein [Candidatus Brocadia sp.]|nr:4Fe-4S binding protein [Candidatus Brocadia sp.]
MQKVKFQDRRIMSLIGVHFYMLFHLLFWYAFGVKIWGKTAMMGVPSLLAGHINAAAIMIVLIIISVLLYGRAFCGWACHLRGAIEFSDWIMRKLNISGYQKIREKNILFNTSFRWLFRSIIFFVLLLPVISYWIRREYSFYFDIKSPSPMADLPGNNNLLFSAHSPFNMQLAGNGFAILDFIIPFMAGIFIVFVMTFVFNYFYGQGAFCRILCPYTILLVPFMNISPWQKKITRVSNCTGCRACSNNCPQGIDVSREIYHYDGKVINKECIKCYHCVDVCSYQTIADSKQKASPQTKPISSYEKTPWLNSQKHLQVIEPLHPVFDFISMIVAFVCGTITSRLGGFWFYVGAIGGYIIFRKLISLILTEEVRPSQIPRQEKEKEVSKLAG